MVMRSPQAMLTTCPWGSGAWAAAGGIGTFSGVNADSYDADGNLIDGGFCCDQVIVYAPQIDRFIWLMQFRRAVLPGDDPKEPSGPNRYRIAAASPAAGLPGSTSRWKSKATPCSPSCGKTACSCSG